MSSDRVRQRCVVYFSGFDPQGARKYHQLYQEHGARMAKLMGCDLQVGPRQTHPLHPAVFWQVEWLAQGERTLTDFVFARWDDVIRQHWPQEKRLADRIAIWWTFLKTHASYLRLGAMRAMWRLARPPALALLLPVLMMGAIAVALLLGLTAAALKFWLLAAASGGVAIVLQAVVAHFEKHWHSLWLARSFSFTYLWANKQTPEMDERVAQHACMLADYLNDSTYDEVLVVGHSSGSMVAGVALAQALRDTAPRAKRFALLGLGHCWPLLTCLPSAHAGRKALETLAASTELTWVEVSSAADGCCFAFVDPLRSLPQQPVGRHRPKLLSARWHTLFTSADYAALKRDRFELHFQYIQATPELGPCDFYSMTAGPLSLADRAAALPDAV